MNGWGRVNRASVAEGTINSSSGDHLISCLILLLLAYLPFRSPARAGLDLLGPVSYTHLTLPTTPYV